VGFQSKKGPKKGIFEVLAAPKMGREQKMREGEGKRKGGNASLRSKRFRGVSEQKSPKNGIFIFRAAKLLSPHFSRG